MIILSKIQINIVLSTLLAIIFVHAYFNMNRTKKANKLFLWIMGLTGFALVLEIFSVILNNPDLKKFIVLHKLVNIIGFIVAPVIPFIGFKFIKEWIIRYRKEKIKANVIFLLPLLINVIGVLLSYKGGGLFHISSENIYERGPLFFILPCVSYIYIIYSLYFIYKHREKFTYQELVMFSLFYIIPSLFTCIQLKYPVYLTTWNSAAIIIVVTYIFIINDQSYRDGLTGLENRLSYEHYTQNVNHKKVSKIFIVYLDLDEFKTINDQYGHSEGDEAIKAFANLLVESFPLRQKN